MSGFCIKDQASLNADGICSKCGTYYPELDGLKGTKHLEENKSEGKLKEEIMKLVNSPISMTDEKVQNVLNEAKADMPKKTDYTYEKSGVYHEYNYGVAWRNWALKWFGEELELLGLKIKVDDTLPPGTFKVVKK